MRPCLCNHIPFPFAVACGGVGVGGGRRQEWEEGGRAGTFKGAEGEFGGAHAVRTAADVSAAR